MYQQWEQAIRSTKLPVPYTSIGAVLIYFICLLSGCSFSQLGVVLTFTLVVLIRDVLAAEVIEDSDVPKPSDFIVIVGGDFSKATRMQYHVLSLSSLMPLESSRKDRNGIFVGKVHVIAYSCDAGCVQEVQDMISSRHVVLHLFSESIKFPLVSTVVKHALSFFGKWSELFIAHTRKISFRIPRLRISGTLRALHRFLIAPIIKALWIIYVVFVKILLTNEEPSKLQCFLVQNPPTIPILPIARICAWLLSCQLVVDWHNIGSTLLGYSLFQDSGVLPVARTVQWRQLLRFQTLQTLHFPLFVHFCFEFVCGQGDRNLVVSHKMGKHMLEIFNLSLVERIQYALTVSSRSAYETGLNSPSIQQKKSTSNVVGTVIDYHDRPLLSKLKQIGNAALSSDKRESQIHEYWKGIGVHRGNARSFYVIMSCSWSKDDDVGFLFDAILRLSKISWSVADFPSIHVVVTGTGPNHGAFLRLLETSRLAELRNAPLDRPASGPFTVFYSSPLVTSMYFDNYETYMETISRCHLGLCVHRTSGVADLPMKIIEYYTCGVPVVALHYNGIEEILEIRSPEDQANTVLGWSADTPERMAQLLNRCLLSWADPGNDTLESSWWHLLSNVQTAFQSESNCWEARWKSIILPIFDSQ
ncbi:glycosyltransferase [Perkinsela sp. CCAP 1560/4]|nr:glycosyltransferase [Perkinsela sp. CCAP 1560/4]|eukprot:KNH09699.1 glycosyltransferase [Perkinsela sp. CCAP 1560/4]